MLRPVAAGLMCLGFVTLGVALSRGQEAAEKTPPASPAALTAVEENQVDAERDNVIVEIDSDKAMIKNPDGKAIESNSENRSHGRAARQINLREGIDIMVREGIDPGTVEILDTLIAGLKDEVKRLSREGKKADVATKLRSIRVLARLLEGTPHERRAVYQSTPRQTVVEQISDNGPGAEEMSKFHDHIRRLHENLFEVKDEQDRAKIQHEIAHLEKLLAERRERAKPAIPALDAVPGAHHRGQFAGGQPGMPGYPAGPLFGFGGGSGGSGMGAPAPFVPHALPHAVRLDFSADVLMQKSQALFHAANQLKNAGLEEQSSELQKQGEKLRDEAQKLRAQTQPGFGFGGPPMELHRSIRELHEQIEQLRKEVGELRELLQQRL